jgi:hypothetical protein
LMIPLRNTLPAAVLKLAKRVRINHGSTVFLSWQF